VRIAAASLLSRSDEIWFVLEGEVTFYTTGDEVVARLGRWGGILIPREVPYWFESSGSEPLVILRFGAVAQNVKDARVDLAPPSDTIKALLGNLPTGER
jgi:mannose-6-phosphate isomerase-like protein (cupin superfamily)